MPAVQLTAMPAGRARHGAAGGARLHAIARYFLPAIQ